MISNTTDKTVKTFTINMASLDASVPLSDIEEDQDVDGFDSYPSPPLRTPFGPKADRQVMFVNNA